MRVPGIGRTFARAIVDHFGATRVFEELDRDPERLREVRTPAGRRIAARTVERAIAAWREVATIREVEAFLFTHGIGAGLAARLVRRYGDEVVAVLTREPYRLVELPRIGFRVADRIAQSLGIEPDDAQRVRAGLRFALEEAEADGNVFLAAGRSSGSQLAPSSASATRSSSSRRSTRSSAMPRWSSSGDRVYRSELHEMEVRLGEALGTRSGASDVPLFAEPSRPDSDLSDEQWSVVELVRTHPLVLLTGLPGAGKTHTQRVLVDLPAARTGASSSARRPARRRGGCAT